MPFHYTNKNMKHIQINYFTKTKVNEFKSLNLYDTNNTYSIYIKKKHIESYTLLQTYHKFMHEQNTFKYFTIITTSGMEYYLHESEYVKVVNELKCSERKKHSKLKGNLITETVEAVHLTLSIMHDIHKNRFDDKQSESIEKDLHNEPDCVMINKMWSGYFNDAMDGKF